MSKEVRERITATMKARAYPRNSHLYRWLRDNRRIVDDAFKATGAGWQGLLAVVLDAGVMGRHGAPPNERSVRKVWLRVCADIDAETAARAAATKERPQAHRSRARGDWQPPVSKAVSPAPTQAALSQSRVPAARAFNAGDVSEHRRTLQAPTQPATAEAKKKITFDDLPPEAKAQFDRLRQDFAETDRKRFGRY